MGQAQKCGWEQEHLRNKGQFLKTGPMEIRVSYHYQNSYPR